MDMLRTYVEVWERNNMGYPTRCVPPRRRNQLGLIGLMAREVI